MAEREAAAETVPDPTVHPAIADSYLAAPGSLEAALCDPEGAMEAQESAAARDLLDCIIVTPTAPPLRLLSSWW